MEAVIQILTENCAGVEARADIKRLQYKIITPIHIEMEFPKGSDRKVRLFDLPECETTVFDLLRDPQRLSGLRINNDIFWIHQRTTYTTKPLHGGLHLEIHHPKRERVRMR